MFDNLVATGTIADEILEAVCFLISLYAKLAKGSDMVNVKLLSQHRLGCSAILTNISISMPCIAALLAPVRAIVRLIAAFPSGVVAARRVARGAQP